MRIRWAYCIHTGEILVDRCRCPKCGMALLPFGDAGWFHPPVHPTSQQILDALEPPPESIWEAMDEKDLN